MDLAYAGIGSRETPTDELQRMREIAAMLGDEGWCLRSGGGRPSFKTTEAIAT